MKYLDEHPEIRIECGKKNIVKAKEVRLEKIKEFISNISIEINPNSIDIKNIIELKKNDICGAYIIKVKFKDDIVTDKEGAVYNLLACKPKRVYAMRFIGF